MGVPLKTEVETETHRTVEDEMKVGGQN